MAGTYKSTGIVFRQVKYSETSLIIDIYTLDKGLRSFIISGARSQKSKTKASIYHVMNIVDMVAYEVDQADKLARIREIHYHYHYQKIPFDVIRSSIGTFILEVFRNAIHEHEANEELFTFVVNTFAGLDAFEGKLSTYPLFALLGLSQHLGFFPRSNWSNTQSYFDLIGGDFVDRPYNTTHILDLEESKAFYQMLAAYEANMVPDFLTLDAVVRNKLLDQLLRFIGLHLEGFRPVKSIEVIRAVLH